MFLSSIRPLPPKPALKCWGRKGRRGRPSALVSYCSRVTQQQAGVVLLSAGSTGFSIIGLLTGEF